MSDFVDFTAEEKLIRARVHLQKDKPFWSYLCMSLNLVEEPSVETCGVDTEGNLYFNPAYVNKLNQDEIKGVMAHEVMHCALEHMDRGKDKNKELFNISSDIVVNAILQADGLQLPKDVLKGRNDEFEIFGVKFTKITEKTSEEVYDALWKKLGKQIKAMEKAIQKAINDAQGFDKHIYSEGNGNGNGKKKKKCSACNGTGKGADGKDCPTCNGKGEIEIPRLDWKRKLVDACSYARQRGNLPLGMERIVGKLLETHIDWKGLLYRFITNQIPVDYTWARPSKRSHSLGIYLPTVEKEKIDVMAWVDTSGSIGQDELAEFISEIASIVGSFKNVDLTVGDCDCRVNGTYELKNANKGEIISKIGKKLRGGGGTSHVPVFKWINKNKPNTKFVICFTDGYTEFPPKAMVKMPVLWVVAGYYRENSIKFPYGKVIELPKRQR